MKRIASLYKNQRMQLVRSFLAMLSFLILFVAPSMASHIVGGSISYRCLGNDQYEITVRVFRDCFNATPGADFDDPASIGIFDRAGLLVADLRVPFVSEDTLTTIPNECLMIPGNVCVNTTTYVTTVELPFLEGGYQLVYQRCCRNETLQNLVNPLETGATYDIWLTEASMLTCNSSPVFREWPPIFICVNEELNFDHSAIDADGDSLVYKLIAPLQGGTFAEPMPQPPNPPPYDDVLLIEPTYSVDNFLGFGEPLKVDQDNGLMTVTPGIMGQFVVGVSVEEYDRETGELLSVSRRDFQYNVIQCEPFQAAFNAPEAVCDQFTVQFDNQTAGADEFLWTFTDEDTSFTSMQRSPEITFPSVGLYNVELIVAPNSVCEVQFAQDILVQTNSLTADFRVDVLACTDSSYLFLTDRSVDSVSAPVAWEWIINPEGMDPLTVNGQFPIVPVPMDSKGTIQLNVTSENNCMSSSTMTYEAPGIDLRTYLQDTIYACTGDEVGLNPSTPADVQLDYSWSGPGLNDPSLINPMIEVQTGTTVYQLTISGPENSCFIEADIVVISGESLGLDFSVGANCDGLSYRFEDLSTNANSIEWIIGDLSAPLLISQESNFDFTFPMEGSYPVYLIGVADCMDTLLRNIDIRNNDLDVGIDVRYIDCEADQIEVQLMAQTATTDSIISYDWRLSNGETSTEPNPIFSFGESQTLTASLMVETLRGCMDSVEQELEINLITDVLARLPDTVALCDGRPTALFPENDDKFTYEWSPAEGLDDPTSSNPTFLQPGTYNVVISIPGSASCLVETQVVSFLPEVINLDLTVSELPDDFNTGEDNGGNGSVLDGIDLDNLTEVPIVDGKVISCSSALLLTAETDPEVSVSWYLNGEEVSVDSLYYLAQATGENTYTAIATDRFGCTDTSTVVIDLKGVDIVVPDQVAGCVGDAFDLFPGADSTLDYSWEPANLLDDPNAPNPRTISLDRDTTFFVKVTLPGTTCIIEDTVVVDVNEDIILDITADPGLMVCPRTTVTLEAELEEEAIIAWLDADGNLLGTADTLGVDVMDEPIEITAVARDTNGCEQRQTITLTPEDLNIGLDSPVEACAEIPTPINPGGSADYTYEWSPATGLDDPFSPNPIFDASMDQTFGVTVTDPVTGCIVMDSVEVVIIDHPSITVITNDTMICEPTTITLMAETDQPTTLEWFADAEMTMSLGTGTSIEVMPGEGLNEYFVKTGDEICVDDRDVAKVRVEIVDFTAVAPDTLLEICKDEETRLNPNGDDRFSYGWSPAEGLDDPLSPNPLFDGAMDQDFTIVITSPDGMCMVERMQKVRLLDPVNLDAGTDTILCREGSFTLEAIHEGGQNVMWAADRDFTESVSNGDSYEIELEDGGRFYYVKAENSLGCAEMDSIFVGSGWIDAMLPEEVLVCDATEGAMLLVSNNKPDQELTYMWMPEDKFESDPLVGPMATLEPGADGLISVIVENQYGCSAELNTRVVIDDVGSARIEASDTLVVVGNPVELSVEDCEDCQYQWSPAETIDNPNSSMVIATPLETTEYFVTVTKGDCETVLSITITTEGVLCTEENIFVPRAFTPNGDNQNDVLFVRSEVIDEMHFIIYNRWGQEVFDTRDINEGWDGTFRGSQLPPDVYGYYLRARCVDDSELTLQGNVTLLR